MIDPESKAYGPCGAAKELFYCRDKEALIEGPAGTGKSLSVLEKINLCLLKYPGARGLILRKTRASMTESVLVTLEAKVFPKNREIYPDTQNVTRSNRRSYDYPNGSSMVVGGLDNPDRIMSTEYDIAALFEATEGTENDWELVTTRLRNGVMPYQQAIADCNPSAPSHWLNQRAGRGAMTRLLSRHNDNPRLFQKNEWTPAGTSYLETLGRLTGARKLRLLNGTWAAQEGLVYEEFDAAIHLIDPFPIPKEWRRIRSIDFGFTNPFVCQWFAIDPDDRYYLYREIYKSRRLVEDHARQINELSTGESYEATVSDHDAEDRATLDRRGIRTTTANKSVTPGIEAVASRLRKTGDGKPRLFLMRDCLVEKDHELAATNAPYSTQQEFDGYSYAKRTDGKENKEEPVKLNDHGMDALRYACMYRPIQRTKGTVILM